MKIKAVLFTISFMICCRAFSQQPQGNVKAPKYQQNRAMLLGNITHALNASLIRRDTAIAFARALFFVKFQIDAQGKLCNVKISNEHYSQPEGLEKEGIDSVVRTNINAEIKKWLVKTSGNWEPASVDNKPVMSRPLLIVVDCNGPLTGGQLPNDNYFFDPLYYPIFPGEENEAYLIFGALSWNGRYKS